MKKIIVGTRGSKLAIIQTNMVIEALKRFHPGLEVDIITIKTTGDRILDKELSKIGGKGLFIKEIEEALDNGEIDFAIHSTKDMPHTLPEQFEIAAVLKREDPRDVLICRDNYDLNTLPSGSKAGTSSLRRMMQLKALRSDLEFLPIRGNVDTRLNKLANKEFDAIVLAAAGLKRLFYPEDFVEALPEFNITYLDPENYIPSVGQGALSIEIRKGNKEIFDIVRVLNDETDYKCVLAERSFLRQINGGCEIPTGAYCTANGNQITIDGFIGNEKTGEIFRSQISGNIDDYELLGCKLACHCERSEAIQKHVIARHESSCHPQRSFGVREDLLSDKCTNEAINACHCEAINTCLNNNCSNEAISEYNDNDFQKSISSIVYLVGAGPGDESLITLKALECIKKADVIIYDSLINDNLLFYAKDTAEKIYVGKRINNHTLPQEEINELLVKKAKEGNIVVRLKGGDPYVFGRGGEEALKLKEENIPFEVVPGVSSSVAALNYAGIPVTMRGVNTSFHVITGHEGVNKEVDTVNYDALAHLDGTLVFLMGLNNVNKIRTNLLKYGKSPKTPTAVISNGTTPEQKVAIGTLENIEEKLEGIVHPAIIVVGEVVNLRESLNWFEMKPLFGRKILVTRARHQASVLSKKIAELGGSPIEFPTIEIQPNSDNSQMKDMCNNLNNYQWIIFTSANGAEIFFDKLKQYDIDIRSFGNTKICTIGKATREAVEAYCLKVEFTPPDYVAESLIEGLKERIKKGDRVLIPRAEVARELLPEKLKEFGAVVDVIPLYQTVIPEHSRENLMKILSVIDTITFASSSTVSNFIKILGFENISLLDKTDIACIGPVTYNSAIEAGLKNCRMAKEYTIDGLVNLLMEK